MKARISEELENLINEKIYLDLEIHVLTNRIEKAKKINDEKLSYQLENVLNIKFKEVKAANDTLRKQNVKIEKPKSDDMFVQYDFYVKGENGGYKEGNLRYWKSAIKYKLKERLNKKK